MEAPKEPGHYEKLQLHVDGARKMRELRDGVESSYKTNSSCIAACSVDARLHLGSVRPAGGCFGGGGRGGGRGGRQKQVHLSMMVRASGLAAAAAEE